MPVNLNLKNYQKLDRKDLNGKRHYLTPGSKPLPSVTTILEATKSEEDKRGLAIWKARVGKTNAQKIVTEAANVGTAMHKKLELYCKNELKEPGSNLIQKQSHNMAQVVIANGLSGLEELWGNEVALYHSEIYAGTTDCAGVFRGKPSILDFKQTNKPKKREYITSYFLQLAAYSLAHDWLFPDQPIEQGAILICSRNLEYQEFILNHNELIHWQNAWWDRVTEYLSKNP